MTSRGKFLICCACLTGSCCIRKYLLAGAACPVSVCPFRCTGRCLRRGLCQLMTSRGKLLICCACLNGSCCIRKYLLAGAACPVSVCPFRRTGRCLRRSLNQCMIALWQYLCHHHLITGSTDLCHPSIFGTGRFLPNCLRLIPCMRTSIFCLAPIGLRHCAAFCQTGYFYGVLSRAVLCIYPCQIRIISVGKCMYRLCKFSAAFCSLASCTM